MRKFRPFLFIQAAGRLGITSVAVSFILFIVSIIEHARAANVTAYLFLVLAPVFFSIGAYMAWSAEHDKWLGEVERNSKPSLKIELLASFFDVSKVPGTQDAQVHIYAYLRVTNVREPETLVTRGTLKLTVGGVEHTGNGDDISRQGDFLEHNSGFRLGGERKGDVFGEIRTPVKRLTTCVNGDNPLRRGIHQDGLFVFTFRGQMDWDRENPYVMEASHARLSLTDSLGDDHRLDADRLTILNGTLKSIRPGVIVL